MHADSSASRGPGANAGEQGGANADLGRCQSENGAASRGKADSSKYAVDQRPFSPPLDREKVKDKQALKKADRLAEQDARYIRRPMSPEEFGEVKVRWQTRQLKRVSSAASVFGARESSKDLLQIMAEFERDSRTLKRAMQEKQNPEAAAKEHDEEESDEGEDDAFDEEAGPGTLNGTSSLEAAPAKSSVRKKMASLFKRVLGRKGTQMNGHPSVLDQLAAKQLQDGVST
eukprot:CAMPEP_0173423950 /NCGR_PEP_ID=MMETSP1357-20121228/4034_1 /TAXON_ID=77926 /ORGANISM="Hemiselmis rufescens, Strain PCC563" /LENGTH=229 /DNA_ID=CAMNT_0014387115 /DNA_START=69 /DNA_END=754 /DNA_ORIENTATION=+